jgi:hypothetical protein
MGVLAQENKPSCGSAWWERAAELADWTLARLAHRTDAWGGYWPNGQVTRYGLLNRTLLIRHYHAQDASDIIGLHTADANNRGRWGALDIDQHGDDLARAEANWLATLHWYGELVLQGFQPFLTASNGKGGYHLRILLAEDIDAAQIYHFLRQLTADHRTIGLDKPPEQFPKQADVRRCEKRLGNWLRLPGRHHKRDFWSSVWSGSEWLAENDAIDFLLSLTGDDPALIPELPPSSPPAPRTYHVTSTRRTYRISSAGHNLATRIAAYLRRLPNLGEGQGRDDVAFGFACFLVRDLALADSIALEWLEVWDRSNCPPKGRKRLTEILKSAHAYGQRSIGCGLSPEQPNYDRRGHLILRATGEVR